MPSRGWPAEEVSYPSPSAWPVGPRTRVGPVALVPFDIPSIFRCAVEFGRVLSDNMTEIQAHHRPAECITGRPDDGTLETAHIRLIQSLLPYSDPELTSRLRQVLTSPPDISEGLPTPEECEDLDAISRLLRDCACAAEGPEAGKALLELTQALMDWRSHGGCANLACSLGGSGSGTLVLHAGECTEATGHGLPSRLRSVGLASGSSRQRSDSIRRERAPATKARRSKSKEPTPTVARQGLRVASENNAVASRNTTRRKTGTVPELASRQRARDDPRRFCQGTRHLRSRPHRRSAARKVSADAQTRSNPRQAPPITPRPRFSPFSADNSRPILTGPTRSNSAPIYSLRDIPDTGRTGEHVVAHLCCVRYLLWLMRSGPPRTCSRVPSAATLPCSMCELWPSYSTAHRDTSTGSPTLAGCLGP